jgi:hypothetical protein
MGALRFADLRRRPTEVLDLTSLTKTYPLQVVQGRLFGIGQSKAHQWIHVLLVVLRTALRTRGMPRRAP